MQTLNGSLGLKEEVDLRTNLGVINRVIARILPAELRRKVYSVLREEIFREKSGEKIKEAREEWQRQHGLVVFSEEESAYLFELRGKPENKKGTKHINNEKIAAAMNERFGTDRFTRENCRQHAANQAFQQQKKTTKRKNARPVGSRVHPNA